MMQANIIGLDDIAVGPRKRPLDEGKVAALQASIAAVGLLQPVVITDTYTLIAGRHRIEAVRRLGWTTIPARVMNLDGLRAELAEIDENLTRNELTVLEQGEHLHRRNEILAALGLRAKPSPGTNQYTKREVVGVTVSPTIGDASDPAPSPKTTADLAAEIGISERSAQRRLQVARSLASDVKDEIAATPLADSTTDLVDLARLDAAEQRAIIAMDGVKEGRTSVRFARRKLGEWKARARAEERARPDAVAVAAGLPVRLIVGDAECLDLPGESVDVIITSPPYNLQHENWPMGGHGRVERAEGIGYDDAMDDAAYQTWQLRVLSELYRVARPGASLFYNHKTRTQGGVLQHPMTWLCRVEGWTIRQEIIWDREVTHNHSATLFWPVDERVYWLTNGAPTLDGPVGMPTVWRFHGPQPHTWHPAPFVEELPRRCLQAVGGATRKGLVVLDPFAGSCTTLKVALDMGHAAIGVDCNAGYLEQARAHYGW